MTDIKIRVSKVKNFFFIIAAIIFIAGAYFGIFYIEPEKSTIVIKLFAIAGILLGFAGIGMFIYQLAYGPKFTLIINDEEIIFPGPFHTTIINRADVTHVRRIDIHGQKMLVLGVKNPEEYLVKVSPKIATMMKFNMRYGGPFCASAVNSVAKFEDIVKIFTVDLGYPEITE
ncbi:hypothetical protein AAIR98_001121 [Elusimicrobium simillimum]|uniref:STM3941 family protein n=1 Tax=Elusimicrobium simillimum TaxID=3143438 RepID=UPI003C6FE984